MRQFIIAIIAALALSGCKTSGYNPLKIETEQGWQKVPSLAHILESFR
jgi:hypothetical protein